MTLAIGGLVLVAGAAGAVGLVRRQARLSSIEPLPSASPTAATPLPGPQELPAPAATAPAPFAPADSARVNWLLGVSSAPPPSPSPPQPQTVSAEPPPAPAAVAAAPARDWHASARALHVVIYTTSWCHYCRQAKAWMSANGVPYEERDIEASAEYAQAMRRLNPRGSVPTFDIGGSTMVGFSEAAFIDRIQRASP